MKINSNVLSAFSISGLMLSAILATPVHAQFSLNRAPAKKNLSAYPADARAGYGTLKQKCGTCHQPDDLSQKLEAAPGQEEFWMKKMQAMPSTDLKDRDIQSILKFLAYETAQRPAPTEVPVATTDGAATHPASEGRQFFVEHSCNACHTVGAEKGAGGPPLDGVGARLSRDQLLSRMKILRLGTDPKMPPLPSDTTDLKLLALVDYLQTLPVAK